MEGDCTKCFQAPNEEIARSQASEVDTGPELVIWGTNVVVSKCKQKFKRFIEEFIEEAPADDEVTEEIDRTLPLYLQKLQEVSWQKLRIHAVS
jgi:DNA replication licensing factor MCM4